jgi:superfamily I DNA and RNA helicase
MGIQNHMAGVDTDADVFYRTDTPSVVFTSIYRAKGNEAGMVYVVNAQGCEGHGAGLASLRNRLFTAITRSKAWVRVTGHGTNMERIVEEFEQLKAKDFRLEFEYPTDGLLERLRVVHRDLSPHEKKRLEGKKKQLADVLDAFETGELMPEDLDEETRKKLIRLLGNDQ